MMRFNMMRELLITTALVLGGCAVESSSPDGTGQAVDEVDSARAVFVHEAQGTARASDVLGQGVTHPTGAGLGPSPDPWVPGDGEGPSPDPWQPHTHRGAPPGGDPTDPANALPSTSTPTGGAGGSSSSSNNK
jgi:hypothetical protein